MSQTSCGFSAFRVRLQYLTLQYPYGGDVSLNSGSICLLCQGVPANNDTGRILYRLQLLMYIIWQDVSILLVCEDVKSKFAFLKKLALKKTKFVFFTHTSTAGCAASIRASSISSPKRGFQMRCVPFQRSRSRLSRSRWSSGSRMLRSIMDSGLSG
jgi:hypothetical protein